MNTPGAPGPRFTSTLVSGIRKDRGHLRLLAPATSAPASGVPRGPVGQKAEGANQGARPHLPAGGSPPHKRGAWIHDQTESTKNPSLTARPGASGTADAWTMLLPPAGRVSSAHAAGTTSRTAWARRRAGPRRRAACSCSGRLSIRRSGRG